MSSPFVAHDRAFLDVLGPTPRLVQVAAVAAHEGPTYVRDENALYVTSTPDAHHDASILRLNLGDDGLSLRSPPEVVIEGADGANGMTLDRTGNLIVCVQGSHERDARIERVDRRSCRRSVLVSRWGDLPLNSPNDVVVRSDGTIWFTDPAYGWLQGFRPAPGAGDQVYRFDPATSTLDVVVDDMVKPNGLAFSPDESVLYVGDSGANQEAGSFHPQLPHHVLAWDVAGGRHLHNRRLVAVINPGFPDGLKVDSAGRLYSSAFDGVHVFTPRGAPLGRIMLPGAVNFCFGGEHRDVLYVTTDAAVWAAALAATGGRPAGRPATRCRQGVLA
jgi:gluconolactonase